MDSVLSKEILQGVYDSFESLSSLYLIKKTIYYLLLHRKKVSKKTQKKKLEGYNIVLPERIIKIYRVE